MAFPGWWICQLRDFNRHLLLWQCLPLWPDHERRRNWTARPPIGKLPISITRSSRLAWNSLKVNIGTLLIIAETTTDVTA
jgi:hypothetical protein